NSTPVLAYSLESWFNANASNVGVSDWMKHASASIYHAIQNNITATSHIQTLWNDYTEGVNPISARAAAAVGPLLTTAWNQEPYYNALCPVDGSTSAQTVTGCVATAMAQIMKYWSYPAKGTGSYSYNDAPPLYSNNFGTQSANFGTTYYLWNNMPNAIYNTNNSVDTLMYQCGVSVAMDYGTDVQGGSGAYVLQSEVGNGNPCSQYAYVNYFSYDGTTIQGVRKSQYTDANWLALMEGEINAGRVIQYEGDDPTQGGHTWVCDGYDINDLLHMNWGWGGADNGYFSTSNLNADGANFSQNEAALIGIQPVYPFSASVAASSSIICPGTSSTLTATGPTGATYSWSPTAGLSCSTCATTVASPASSTLYTVTIDNGSSQVTKSVAVVIAQKVTPNFTFRTTTGCNLPQDAVFTNTSTHAGSYLWDFGDGTTSTTESPSHSYNAYGAYTVKLIATNQCGQDSIIKSQAVVIANNGPVAADQNICAGESTILSANSSTGTIGWYTAATNGNLLTTGNVYYTPNLSASTTYYVQSTISTPVNSVGPTLYNIGAAAYYTHTSKHGLIFNCTTEQILTSVDVYSDSAGVRVIELLDANNNLLDSVMVNIANGHKTISLNFDVPVATGLQLVVSGFQFLDRNTSGGNFPYNSTDHSVSITGNTPASTSAYNFFYNWKLQQPACVTSRTPVHVFVLGNGDVNFTATGSGTTVQFTPVDTNASSYEWSFGDGTSSNEVNPSHTYSAANSYSVQLIISNGNCTDTIIRSVNTETLGIDATGDFKGFNIFPNPTHDNMTVEIHSGIDLLNCTLTIRDILGRPAILNDANLHEGVNTINIDVTGLAAGVYTITLQHGKDSVTKRLIKTN
ncbi:MAG TPA: C10 family peptidase, partial [Chitinophagales bacterium]|nr:C10 family peptidase [Chitinophagales bacterium]